MSDTIRASRRADEEVLIRAGSFQCWSRIGVVLLVALLGAAPSSPWDGTWKLNISKSGSTEPAFSISKTASGEYYMDFFPHGYTFACNGKDYPTTSDSTISCSQPSASIIDSTVKRHGTKALSSHMQLSPDGGALTVTSNSIQADGSATTTQAVYRRLSGSGGFVGGWETTNPGHGVMSLTLKNQRLHLSYVGTEEYVDLSLDGSDAILHGVSPGVTLAMKSQGPRELQTVKKRNGQVSDQGSLKVSADGNTLVEEYWRPGRPTQKTVLVYEKQ